MGIYVGIVIDSLSVVFNGSKIVMIQHLKDYPLKEMDIELFVMISYHKILIIYQLRIKT